MAVIIQLPPFDFVASIPRTLGLKQLPTVDFGSDRRALLCRVVHFNLATCERQELIRLHVRL